MGFYKLASKDEQKQLRKYSKLGEKIKVSSKLEVNGKLYREAIFYKRFLANISGQVAGSVFFDSEYNKVEDKNILRELVKLSYFAEVLCDDESTISLNRALKVEGDFKKDEQDFEDMKKAFVILNKEGILGERETIELEKIIKQFFSLRKDTNLSMKTLLETSTELLEKKAKIDGDFVEEVYESYMNVLINNFMKVRYLLTGKHFYNEIYDKLKKYKKKLKIKLRANNMLLLNKLEYTVLYYIKILNTYESVIYMNKSQYERHLKNIEKENIEGRLQYLR